MVSTQLARARPHINTSTTQSTRAVGNLVTPSVSRPWLEPVWSAALALVRECTQNESRRKRLCGTPSLHAVGTQRGVERAVAGTPIGF